MSVDNDLIDGFDDDAGLGGIDDGPGDQLDDIEVQWAGDDPNDDQDDSDDVAAAETPAATDDDDPELQSFPDKIKKRIERERRLKREAVQAEKQRADRLEAELEAERRERLTLQQAWQENQGANIDQEIESLKAKYKAVRAEFDPDKADEELDLLEKIQELQHRKRQIPSQAAPRTPPVQAPKPETAPARVNKAAESWISKNEWYGKSEYAAQTSAAQTIDNQLAAEGFDTHSPEYFNELDRRLRKVVRVPGSERPRTESPVQTGRHGQQQGRRATVTLTKADQDMMRRMGYDPRNKEQAKQFAREKLALEN